MNRADAEKDVRSVTRTCRGPHVLSVATVVGMLAIGVDRERKTKVGFLANSENDAADLPSPALGDDHDAAWFTESLEASLLSCKTIREVIRTLHAVGARQAAQSVNHVARDKGCGADFNDVMCAGPLDGTPQVGICPKCKVSVSYTPANYTIDASSESAAA